MNGPLVQFNHFPNRMAVGRELEVEAPSSLRMNKGWGNRTRHRRKKEPEYETHSLVPHVQVQGEQEA